MRITLPLPPAALSPNSRGHWSKKHKATQSYRALARAATPKKGLAERWERALVQVTYFTRTATRPDEDNALNSLKPAWDGIADAGVVHNDRAFSFLPVRFEIDPKNPRVEVEITPLEAE